MKLDDCPRCGEAMSHMQYLCSPCWDWCGRNFSGGGIEYLKRKHELSQHGLPDCLIKHALQEFDMEASDRKKEKTCLAGWPRATMPLPVKDKKLLLLRSKK